MKIDYARSRATKHKYKESVRTQTPVQPMYFIPKPYARTYETPIPEKHNGIIDKAR